MKLTISPVEARVLGCLIEKEATTPDVYPLTLNSLLTACNQKSSRDPVMMLDGDEVQQALDSLIEKSLAATWNANRTRMAKYKHLLHDRISDEFSFSRPELAVLGTLFLRGPQTAGEIRTRCTRIHEFDSLETLQQVLSGLETHACGPYITVLPREAGRKESRVAHLFCGAPDEQSSQPTPADNAANVAYEPTGSGPADLEALQTEVTTLRSQLLDLEQRFEQFTQQFD